MIERAAVGELHLHKSIFGFCGGSGPMPEATPARRLAAALLAAIGLAPDARACGDDWIVADVIDGDTVRIVNPALPPPLDALSLGCSASTPKRAAAPCRPGKAKAATAFVRRVLARADTVSVVLAMGQVGRPRLGRVAVDGRDLATLLIRAGHAAPYGGGSRRVGADRSPAGRFPFAGDDERKKP